MWLLRVTPLRSGKIRIYTGPLAPCLVFFPLCHLHSRLTKNNYYFPIFFSPTPFIAIHSTIHLLKLGSPPPHKEARQRRKELRKKQLAEQEELERQMKELQVANESKQQELEAVRKVGMGAGLGEDLSFPCRSHHALLRGVGSTKTNVVQF